MPDTHTMPFRIDIITCLPDLLESFFAHSILKRAADKGLAKVVVHSLRPYGIGKHLKTDDYAFGGGAGMVMMPEPLAACIRELQAQRKYDAVVYTTPDGQTFNQNTANRMSMMQNIIIICGHYKGIDERIREIFVTDEISIGDFVLSGGELPAAVIADALIRLLPGVLNDETSALSDSFQDDLLAPPVYTRPANFEGQKVPEILLSGHQQNIDDWRFEQAVERTKVRRPDLYDKWTKDNR